MKKNNLIEDIKLMKKVKTLLYKKYGNSKKNYNKLQINNLIKVKSSTFLINFQERAIFDDFSEYNKRFYRKHELKAKLKQFFEYYINYLNFFCRPIFRNFYYNSLLHYCYDIKADIFYKNNYKEKEINDIIDDAEEDNKKPKSAISEQKENEKDVIKEKIDKINILIFDKETRNKIDNSSVIISSIERLKEDELNMSYTKKLKINDNSYITLRNNKENLLEFIQEIKSNKNNKKNQILNDEKIKEILINNSSSTNKIIYNNNLSGEINLISNYLKNKKKIGIDRDIIKNFKIFKNFVKNKKDNKSINKAKEKGEEQECINTLKNKKIKKLEINFKNNKSNIYNLFKNNFENYKSKINKNNNNSKKNIEINYTKNSNINLDEKRFSLNNQMKKYKPKIIENKKNSLINTTDYFRNNLSIINNKSMKMKTININNATNHNISSLNKNQPISYCKNNKKYNNNIIGKNIQIWRNSKKNSLNSIMYNTNNINSNNNYNLLKIYLKNCPNIKRKNKNKSLKGKAKTVCQSTDQMKTFSVRLIKSYNKKNKYNDRILAFFNNFKYNFTRSNNISINDKNKKSKIAMSKNAKINKSHSNSIIKRKKDNNWTKKNNLGNKNELNLNVNLNLHSIFININPNTIYHQNNNNNESLNNMNKKIELNSNLYSNFNISGKSTKIKKNKNIIKNDYYKNKTQSYKSRNKTKNKIKKTKNINSFVYINNNLNSKNIKEEKDKLLKRNYTSFKIKKEKEKEKISRNAKSKISLSLNKKIKSLNIKNSTKKV